MLILVGVTINVAISGGLFSKAREANLETRAALLEEKVVEWKANKEADEYTENKTAQELEELLNDLEDQNLITDEERVTIEQTGQVTIGSRTIVFEEDIDLAKLKKYFLEELELNIEEDPISKFPFPDSSSIPDANASLEFMCYGLSYSGDGSDGYEIDLYVKYNKKAYKVYIFAEPYGDAVEVKDVEFAYQPHGKEGKMVKYDGNKDGTEEEWTILYDNGDNVEIISRENKGNLTLGSNDEMAKTLSNDLNKDGKVDGTDKAIHSYNNAITTLNEHCKKLITNEDKISVRSVGSNPQNSSNENNTLFTSSILNEWSKNEYNNLLKSTDENYEQDLVRMLYWGVTAEDPCWLASRLTSYELSLDATNNSTVPRRLYFSIRAFVSSYFGDVPLLEIWKGQVWADDGSGLDNNGNFEIRPVVKVATNKIKTME